MMLATKPTATFASRLDAFRGVGPGYDQIRLVLSVAILLWHSFLVSYGQNWALTFWASPFSAVLAVLLPMFFGLSGFLVMGSALRVQSLVMFAVFRALRIAPALITEVTLSALIVGPVLTVLPLRNYFSSPMLMEYFTSLVGWIHFRLPGLFTANSIPEVVNSSLWTVGPELLCYVVLSLFIVTGSYKRPGVLVGIVIGYLTVCVAADQMPQVNFLDNRIPTRVLVLCFLFGNLLCVLRHRVPYSGLLTLISGCVGAWGLHYASEVNVTLLTYPALFLVVYFVNALGLTRLPKIPVTDYGDYSYGIYLFGFPVQQAVRMTQATPDPLVNFAIALPMTFGLAVLSWHYVEKPVLNLRKRFSSPQRRVLPPMPIWSVSRGVVCSALAVYGAFVITANDIFPVRDLAKQTFHDRFRR